MSDTDLTFWDRLLQQAQNALTERVTDAVLKSALRTVVNMESEEVALLHKIDVDVSAIKEGPFHTGRLYLAEAQKPHKSSKDALALIEAAQHEFMRALGQENRKTHKINIMNYIGLCFALIGDKESSLDWYSQAYRDSFQTIQALEEVQKNPSELGFIVDGAFKMSLVAGLFTGIGVLLAIPLAALSAMTTASKMRVVAKANAQAEFLRPIASGILNRILLRLSDMQFFAAEETPPDVDRRKYNTSFQRQEIRRIYTELKALNKGAHIDFQIEWAWYGPSGDLWQAKTQNYSLTDKFEGRLWSSVECNDWTPGTYKVECRLSGQRLISGSFVIGR